MPKGIFPRHVKVRRHIAQPLGESYRFIPLTRNQLATVDVDDFERLSCWNWQALWAAHTNTFYAVRRGPGNSKIQMSREVLSYEGNNMVDHENHDSLDNRKQNLRVATRVQNNGNQRLVSRNTSGYIGVHWHKSEAKWQSRISCNGKRVYLGSFGSSEDAARAYDVAAKKHRGEFAVLNFP